MSYPMIEKVREAFRTDQALNPVDKMVLHEYAWRTPEHSAPRAIRYKTYARDLGLSVNGVKKAVRHLIELGYLSEIAVVVAPGAKLEGAHKVTPKAASGGDHPVTPGGSPSDPQRDHPVTPIKIKRKKEGATRKSGAASTGRNDAPLPCEGAGASLSLSDLTGFQRTCLAAGNSLYLKGGQTLLASDPVYRELAAQAAASC